MMAQAEEAPIRVGVVAFLASDRAAYITGQVIGVNGATGTYSQKVVVQR